MWSREFSAEYEVPPEQEPKPEARRPVLVNREARRAMAARLRAQLKKRHRMRGR